jgi:aminopeptidase N
MARSIHPSSQLPLALLLPLVVACAGALGAAEEEILCRCHHGDLHGHADHGAAAAAAGEPAARQYAPDRAVDMLHIKIDCTPDFARHSVRATTSLSFKPIARPLSTLRLDAVDLTVHSVRAEAAGAAVPVGDVVVARDSITVAFPEPIAPGREVTLHVDHSAEPRRGLYFRTPDMGYPAGDTHVWTQGESHEARHWFPCHDYPNEKCTTEMICHVPPAMTVLSNGRLVGEETDPATGLKAVRWLQDKPHVSYLVCLVAGHLVKLEGKHRDVPLAFWTQPSTAAVAANSFRDTPGIMAYFEDEIGVPFPWVKYDQVTIQDFVAGGMENTSLTTLTDQTLFSGETENIRTTRSLDAHEMAHQWFGDLVTCKDWSHLWLNEGFATYYSHLHAGHLLGKDELLYGLWLDAENKILPNAADPRPIVFKGYRDAREQFDWRAYPKGSWVLHMLRHQLGADLYRQAVRTYLERHAYGTVTSDDFRQVLEETSGRPLDRFFDQWLYHARHPDLKIDYRWQPEEKLAHVTVRQTQPVSADVLLFAFPATFRFVLPDGTVVDRTVAVDGAAHEFDFALSAQPVLVRFDPEYTLLARVDFDLPEAMHLVQLERADDPIGRIRAVKALAAKKTRGAVERLGRVLREDPFRGVREQAAAALQAAGSDEALAELERSLAQPDARVRRRVVEALAGYYRPQVMERLVAVARDEANPAIRAAALEGLAKYGDGQARDALLDGLRSESFRQEVAAGAIAALAATHDESLLEALVRTVKARGDAFPPRVLARALETAGRLGSERTEKETVREFLLAHTADQRLPVRSAALAALGELGDPRARPVLEGFAQLGADDRVGKVATEALEKLRQRQPAVPQEVKELRGELTRVADEQRKLRAELEGVDRRVKERVAPPAPPAAPAAGTAPAPAAP